MAWIGGALALGGALISSSAAGDAADTQAGATAGATQEQRRQFDQNRQDLKPYREAGSAAITRLRDLMGLGTTGGGQGALPERFNQNYFRTVPEIGPGLYAAPELYNTDPTFKAAAEAMIGSGMTASSPGAKEFIDNYLRENLPAGELGAPATAAPSDGYGDSPLTRKFTLADFWDDPVTKASYQFGLDQGTKALANMAGARGNRNSGAQLKALERFGTDYTGQQAGQSQARYVNDQTNLYNRLAGISGTGQTAANTTAALGTSSANTIGGLMTAQGNARGAAQIAQGNAFGGALSGIGNYYGQQQTLDKILNRGGYGGGYSNNSPIDPYTYSSNYG